jgi:hypothetical protein
MRLRYLLYFFVYNSYRIYLGGRNSVDGIATIYGLDGPKIKTRWGTRLSVPDQTGPVAHVVVCAMGTVSFLGVKRPGRGADHIPVSSDDATKGFIPYLRLSSVPAQACDGVTFTFINIYDLLQVWEPRNKLRIKSKI